MDFHSCLSKSSNWKEPAAIPALCWRESEVTALKSAGRTSPGVFPHSPLSWGFEEHLSVHLPVDPALATSFEAALGRPAASLSVCPCVPVP